MSNSFIKIDTMILDLVLPKCNIVFGNSFSSVYLQLLLNVNNNKDDDEWKRNRCWMGINTISNNANCSERKTTKLLKEMQQLNLIKKEYKGKLYMFSLCKNNCVNVKEFNNELDNNLLKYINEKDRLKVKKKFEKINSLFKKNEQWYYSKISELKQWIILFEKAKSGSSLFFLMMFSQNFINNNITFNIVSETQIAEKLGTSQSTINRLLNSFEKMNYCTIDYDNKKKSTLINLNKGLISMNTEELKNKINNEEHVICPVCNKKIDNIKKLNSHIKRCKDELHTMLYELQNKNESYTFESILNIYNDNKHKFDTIINNKENDKKAFNNKALELVKYYYSLTNTRCPNWPKEINMIKSQMKNGLSIDEIIEVMKYMSRRSYQDLRFFSNSINDALTIKQCKLDVKVPGTNAYFVRLYFLKTGQLLNDRLMLQGIKKINELRANNYTTEQIETIVNYMIDKKCPNFNFIVNIANEALQNHNYKNEMAKAYTINELVNVVLTDTIEYGIIMLKDSDYDMAKKEILIRLKNDLCAGKVDLKKVNKIYNKFANELAREIYKRKLYDNKFTAQQWALSVNFNLINI